MLPHRPLGTIHRRPHGASWSFVSGQLGQRPDGSHTADQPFEVQVRQALDNLLAILRQAGCGPERVLRVTVSHLGRVLRLHLNLKRYP